MGSSKGRSQKWQFTSLQRLTFCRLMDLEFKDSKPLVTAIAMNQNFVGVWWGLNGKFQHSSQLLYDHAAPFYFTWYIPLWVYISCFLAEHGCLILCAVFINTVNKVLFYFKRVLRVFIFFTVLCVALDDAASSV